MAKSTVLFTAVLCLSTALTGCGQGFSASPTAKVGVAQLQARGGNLGEIKREIVDAIESSGGPETRYEVRKVEARTTEKRGIFAFKAEALRIEDGDALGVLITGTWDAKNQEIDSEEEDL